MKAILFAIILILSVLLSIFISLFIFQNNETHEWRLKAQQLDHTLKEEQDLTSRQSKVLEEQTQKLYMYFITYGPLEE